MQPRLMEVREARWFSPYEYVAVGQLCDISMQSICAIKVVRVRAQRRPTFTITPFLAMIRHLVVSCGDVMIALSAVAEQ